MRSTAWLHAAFGALGLFAAFDASAAPPLQSYNITPGTASVLGFSMGGFMAVQEAVAYSGLYPAGLGVFSGGPFDCARNQIEENCRSNLSPDITLPVADMQKWSGNLIDNVANLAKMKLYLWVGTNDWTIGQGPMDKVNQQFLNFMPASQVRYDVIQGMDHTIFYGNLNGPANALNWIYGTLNPPATGLSGTLSFFDQSAFIGAGLGMDPQGLIYVPASCASGAACKLVVYFHGSYGNYNQVGLSYFQNFTLNYYADTNNLIILYPQTIVDTTPHVDLTNQTVINSYAFWDYRGMYGANYDQHSGAQVAAVAAMAQKIMSGSTSSTQANSPQAGFWWNPSEPGRGYSLEVSPTDGTLYFSAYMFGSDGSPIWYTSTLTANGGKTFTGPFSEYRGGQTLGGAYQAPSQNYIGSMSLMFPTPTTAAMAIVAPGFNTTSVGLQRYQFATNGLNEPPSASQAQTGWWWNPAQPGSGWFIEVQNNALQIAGYNYASNGNPTWYLAENTLSSATSFTGNLAQYSGGQTLGGAFTGSPSMTNASASSIAINFSAADSATLTLQNGVSVPIQRYHF